MPENEELFTVREVSELLGISKYQVYRRITRGDLPAQQARNGNIHYLIPVEAVQKYIAAGGAHVLSSPRVEDVGMLRVSEVAIMTGYAVETIRRMCYEGRLPFVKGVGPRGHLRIPRDAVEKILAETDS
jgi:excisionase family DNA binding protein